MTYVMKYETWMDLTNAGLMKVRSSQLKKIDGALQAYHKQPGGAALSQLRLALHHWKMSKGYDKNGQKPGWVTSERNRRGAVATLDLQLFGVAKPLNVSVLADLAELPFYGLEAWAEDEAREAIREARDEALQELFQGRELVFRKTAMGLAANGLKRHLAKARQNAGEAAAAAAQPAKDAAMDAAKKAFAPAIEQAREIVMGILEDLPQEVVREVLRVLDEMIPDFIGELAGAVAPYFGVVRSGVKTTRYIVGTIKSRYQFYDLGNHMPVLLGGSPEAAGAALLMMVRRQMENNRNLAAIYGTDTVVKGGALALDAASLGVPTVSAVMTPLSGMVASLAVLGVQIRALARDIQEKNKANALLRMSTSTRLSPQLFRECPLLGCWFLACANTSDVLNLMVEDIGQTGWKLDVEGMVSRHVNPIVNASRDFVADARFEVSGLDMSKGATASTLGVFGIKARIRKKMIAKVASAVPFVEDKQDYRGFAAKQGHAAVSRDVLKSRIVGFGSS